jgi:hypothetical protein
MNGRPQHDHINSRVVIAGSLAILCAVAAVAVIAGISARHWGFLYAGANAPLDFAVAEPKLLSAPRADRAKFTAEKKKLLDSYRWDGRSATATVPIDVAIQLSIETARSANGRAQRGER